MSNPWNTKVILIRNGGLDMIKDVINEITQQLKQVNITYISVNRAPLQRLYQTLETHAIIPENYFSYFVSYGLLFLHLDTHQKLKENSDDRQCKKIILYGDLFYSLYYDYTIRHAFPLIKNNIFQHLKNYEITSMTHSGADKVLNGWVRIIAEEEGYDGISN